MEAGVKWKLELSGRWSEVEARIEVEAGVKWKME